MYIPRCLVKLSEIVNYLTCGPKNYSICARLYERKIKGCMTSDLLVYIIDKIFFFDKQHCRKSWLLKRKENR